MLAKAGDILVEVGSDDILGDLNKSIKVSDDGVDGKYNGSEWTQNDYGKLTMEAEGESNVVWAGSGTGGAGLTYAWLRYLMVSKLTKVFVATTVVTPIWSAVGDMVVGDIEESGEDPEFMSFGYGLKNAGDMAYA